VILLLHCVRDVDSSCDDVCSDFDGWLFVPMSVMPGDEEEEDLDIAN